MKTDVKINLIPYWKMWYEIYFMVKLQVFFKKNQTEMLFNAGQNKIY
jgi:hypothetical protein